MRCSCCNRALSDSESTRRVASTGEFLDMCSKCYKDVKDMIPTYNRADVDDDSNAQEWDDDNYADFIEEEESDPYDEGAAEFIFHANKLFDDE